MREAASVLEIVLTIGMFVAVFGGIIALSLWGQRRRRSGVEASTTNARGAEVMLGSFHT